MAIEEEIKILRQLDHPNIIKYYETYEDKQHYYVIMEYCPGGELLEKIGHYPSKVFKESDACQIITKLLSAINHCHARGITHRDIKPNNIMIGADGEIKLIDFGLSKI